MSLTFYRGPEYRALPREPQPWIIKPLIPVSGLVNIYGKPKSGKSYAALGMALAVANGEPEWNGFEVKKHGQVAYLQIDTPREEWADRMERLAAVGYDDYNIHFADMLTVPYPYNVLDPQHLAELKLALDRIKPVLVIVDTLRESFSGDENDSNIMRDVITNVVSASRPAAVIFLSHARKDGASARVGAGEDLMDDNRGTSYVPGRMDVIIRMTQHRFTFKGRASGLQTVEIQQDKELGLVHLPGQKLRYRAGQEAEEQVGLDLRVQRAVNAHRGLSMRELSEVMAPELGKSGETIRKWPEFKEAFKRAMEASGQAVHPEDLTQQFHPGLSLTKQAA
jgi:hypothetical protein